MAKIQIRQGVFETNSSSTHAICIKRDDEVSILDIMFKYGGKTFHVSGGSSIGTMRSSITQRLNWITSSLLYHIYMMWTRSRCTWIRCVRNWQR